jgi:hypothetical protein
MQSHYERFGVANVVAHLNVVRSQYSSQMAQLGAHRRHLALTPNPSR